MVGKVGSGKSSLLAAITAEMNITQGEVCVRVSHVIITCAIYGQVYTSRLSEGFGIVTQV